MKPALKTKWVEALRSGGYKQGFGQLKRDDAFCCLGVLCDVAKFRLTPDGDACVTKGGKYAAYRPMNRAGITPEIAQDLWGMNDRHKKSFNEIADYIEKHL